MARVRGLKELGKYVADCKCGCMLAEKDYKKGVCECPRCGQECVKPKKEKKDGKA